MILVPGFFIAVRFVTLQSGVNTFQVVKVDFQERYSLRIPTHPSTQPKSPKCDLRVLSHPPTAHPVKVTKPLQFCFSKCSFEQGWWSVPCLIHPFDKNVYWARQLWGSLSYLCHWWLKVLKGGQPGNIELYLGNINLILENIHITTVIITSRKKLVAFSFQLVARDIGIADKAFLDLHRWANPDTH